MTRKKEEEAIMECYRRLFKESTPSGDFDKLMETLEKDEFGRKVIPFMDYEIEEDKMNRIIDGVIKEYKIRRPIIPAFKFTILMGCSPKTKIEK